MLALFIETFCQIRLNEEEDAPMFLSLYSHFAILLSYCMFLSVWLSVNLQYVSDILISV